jgi:hypothetical protein
MAPAHGRSNLQREACHGDRLAPTQGRWPHKWSTAHRGGQQGWGRRSTLGTPNGGSVSSPARVACSTAQKCTTPYYTVKPFGPVSALQRLVSSAHHAGVPSDSGPAYLPAPYPETDDPAAHMGDYRSGDRHASRMELGRSEVPMTFGERNQGIHHWSPVESGRSLWEIVNPAIPSSHHLAERVPRIVQPSAWRAIRRAHILAS